MSHTYNIYPVALIVSLTVNPTTIGQARGYNENKIIRIW